MGEERTGPPSRARRSGMHKPNAQNPTVRNDKPNAQNPTGEAVEKTRNTPIVRVSAYLDRTGK
jgi:hypothetical protein